MGGSDFFVELPEAIEKLKTLKAKRVLLHFPAGLARQAHEKAAVLEAEGFEPIVWSEPCFGACDVPFFAAKPLGCSAILSFGHSSLEYHEAVPVFFIEYRQPVKDFQLPPLPFKKVGLLATAQYYYLFGEAEAQLKAAGKEVFFGRPGYMNTFPGQVTGCEVEAGKEVEEKVDGFLLISDGAFHVSELAARTSKPVFLFDPVARKLTKVPKPKPDKRARLVLEKTKIGILASIKPRQGNLGRALVLKRQLEALGKQVLVLTADTFSSSLSNFDVEMYVTTACPRMRDDEEAMGKPIVSAEEVEKLLGEINSANLV